jgi:hypothetical protein
MRQRSVRITMSLRELDRLKCIQAVIDGELPPRRAAERLAMSTRQIRRLADRYRNEGPVGLISRRCRRPSNNRLDAALESQVIAILRERYADFGPTLATEKLTERHQIVLAKETVRRIQIDAGLWIPRKLRPPKIQQPRTRRACVGELIQIDGCEHHWFEDRAPLCTALVFVDDATSRLMAVRFAGTESTFAYFEALREYLERYGKPLALYSDKATIFRVNRPGAVNGPGYTQFSRALYELNIDGICANTPAAKGRVERAHLTLQDRLVKEFRLALRSAWPAVPCPIPSIPTPARSSRARLSRTSASATPCRCCRRRRRAANRSCAERRLPRPIGPTARRWRDPSGASLLDIMHDGGWKSPHMPARYLREPSGTEKSAVTRMRTSCRTSLRGRNATSSPSAKPVRGCSSRAPSTLVKTFSGRKIVHAGRSPAGNGDWMPGFHGPSWSSDLPGVLMGPR